MGVLNITPDSFSDGGYYFSASKAVEQASLFIEQGASYIDVGGESTRPGAAPVSAEKELERVIPVIEAIRERFDIPVSIDTSKAIVMREAVAAGASMINDVCALQNDEALSAAAETTVPLCLMHMQGEPRTMQENPHYDNLFDEIKGFFEKRINACKQAGISKERLILDPGIGFGKTQQHNLQILANLDRFNGFGLPLLIGVSRKSMIGNITGRPVDERMIGSLAAVSVAAWQGAAILRVHDVKETVEALAVVNAIKSAAFHKI